MKPGTLSVALLIGLGAMVACAPAIAQSYPSKEVKLIVPFPPAGVTDLNARILAKHLSQVLGAAGHRHRTCRAAAAPRARCSSSVRRRTATP